MATFKTKTDALYFLGANVKQILDFGEGGAYVHSPAESIKFVQIVNAVVDKADTEPLLMKEMKRVKMRDDSRVFSPDAAMMSLYDFFKALKSSDTCGMMAQGVLKEYIKKIKLLHERLL